MRTRRLVLSRSYWHVALQIFKKGQHYLGSTLLRTNTTWVNTTLAKTTLGQHYIGAVADIFIFDLDGNLVYSVYKELDYATNFISGPYASSGLGDAFRSALTDSNQHSNGVRIYLNFSVHAGGELRGARSIRRVASKRSSVRRVFGYLQIGTGPRRLPLACSETDKEKKPIPIQPL